MRDSFFSSLVLNKKSERHVVVVVVASIQLKYQFAGLPALLNCADEKHYH